MIKPESKLPFSFSFFLLLVAFLSIAVTGCAGKDSKGEETAMKMAPLSEMPADVQSAPSSVQQAYQFAVANPDLMQHLPCYCGCGSMGHTSNYSCYVSGMDENGKPTFDSHALGCSICVDITQDAMRLSREGKTVAEIRSNVDATYSQYGPSNIP